MAKIKFDIVKTFLKVATYGVIGAASTTVIQMTQSGVSIKEAIVYGIVIGIVAGIKNIVKHYFGIDIDFTKLKK